MSSGHLRPDGHGGYHFYENHGGEDYSGDLSKADKFVISVIVIAILLMIFSAAYTAIQSGQAQEAKTKENAATCQSEWSNLPLANQLAVVNQYRMDHPNFYFVGSEAAKEIQIKKEASDQYITNCISKINQTSTVTPPTSQASKDTTCATKWASLSPTQVQDQIDLFAKDHQDLRGPQMPEYTKNNYIATCIKTG